MAPPIHQHFFEQADELSRPPAAGAPRQVNLRRAISAAYYGVFHYLLASVADEFVGVGGRGTPRYALVYRSIDHGAVRELCAEAKKQSMPAKYAKYVPGGAFGLELQTFAGAFLELQERRHSADYDPSVRIKLSDARLAIATARSAVAQYGGADEDQRKRFLTLLAFRPR